VCVRSGSEVCAVRGCAVGVCAGCVWSGCKGCVRPGCTGCVLPGCTGCVRPGCKGCVQSQQQGPSVLCALCCCRALSVCGALLLCCPGRSARRRRGRRLVPFDQRASLTVEPAGRAQGRLTGCGCAVNRHCDQRRPVPVPVSARPARPRPRYPSGQLPPTPRS
jgi:hypothetical protein